MKGTGLPITPSFDALFQNRTRNKAPVCKINQTYKNKDSYYLRHLPLPTFPRTKKYRRVEKIFHKRYTCVLLGIWIRIRRHIPFFFSKSQQNYRQFLPFCAEISCLWKRSRRDSAALVMNEWMNEWMNGVWSYSGMTRTWTTEVPGHEPVPVPLCPLQIPHGLSRYRSRVSRVRNQRPSLRTMAKSRAVYLLDKRFSKIRNTSCPRPFSQSSR